MFYLLSFLAGLLTAISPCVLPALPLIVGSAIQQHRHAPLAVAAGMIVSFTVIGVLLATIGIALGIRQDIIQDVAAILLVVVGVVLVVPSLQGVLEKLLGQLTRRANDQMAMGVFQGLGGQFGLGALLGAVWSPCVGPTLGAAVGMASQSGGLLPATITMLLFSVGSALPLLLIAYGSRKLLLSNRSRLLQFGKRSKLILGCVLIISGGFIFVGLGKTLEAALLNVLPDAWINLISRY